jgi:predicted amidophosphoribosyltransferase
MRDAAKELYRLRQINSLPEWTVVSKNDSPDMSCEGCGTMISKAAKFCPTCETIYDPAWVQVKRPDLWRKQNPDASAATVIARTAANTGGTAEVDIDKLIEEEGK